MRRMAAIAIVTAAVISSQVLLAQPMKRTATGTAGDPIWQGTLHADDGRTFVTDGGFVIDAALARPAKLPERTIPPKVLQDYLSTPHKDEFGFSDLVAAASGKTYSAPNGIALSSTYVNFLRRVLSGTSVRFRMSGGLQPIVVFADAVAVAVLMPVKQ